MPDHRYGGYLATHVAIVKAVDKDNYQVEEVFQGKFNTKEVLNLPYIYRSYFFSLHLRSSVASRSGKPRPFKRENILNSDTRILVYLKLKEKDGKEGLKIVQQGESFFIVRSLKAVSRLREMAKSSIQLQKVLKKASITKVPKKRMDVLWPYFFECRKSFYLKNYCGRLTYELGKPAGDYILERIKDLEDWQRRDLFQLFPSYNNKKMHEFLKKHLKLQPKVYMVLLKETTPTEKSKVEERISNELLSGLIGLGGFNNYKDLNLIQNLTVWALNHGLKNGSKGGILAFRNLPHKKNLFIMERVWEKFGNKKYPEKPIDNHKIRYWDFMYTLEKHSYPESVPLLVKFLNYRANHEKISHAQKVLTQIVGKDLGSSPEPWLKWYEKQKKKI